MLADWQRGFVVQPAQGNRGAPPGRQSSQEREPKGQCDTCAEAGAGLQEPY